jgi:hypothetical protein
MEILEKFKEFDNEYLGYLEFLEKLQLDVIIKFHNIKWSSGTKDQIIRVVYREEVGIKGRCPGVGCIEYATLDDNFIPVECHHGGFFPCQTFMSMRDWFRGSDSYEIISESDEVSIERANKYHELKRKYKLKNE